MCMASQIFSEAPSTERAPRKGPRGQLLYTCFFPSPILSLAHSLALFALLCSTDAFYLMFFPVPFHCDLSHPTFFTLYCFLSLSLLVSPPHECWWHWFPYNWAKITDYRERERLYIPRELKSIQLAVLWCQVFSSQKREHSTNAVCTNSSKPAKANFPNFCLVVVKFWGKLATSWPLPQMLRPSKPTWINISR